MVAVSQAELLRQFKAVFEVCGLQKILEVASKHPDLSVDVDTFISSLAHDCVETVSIHIGAHRSDGFSFLETSATPQTLDETLMILTYELGKVIYCYHYAKRYGPKSYEALMKQNMQNVISMSRMVCEHKGWDYEALKLAGEEHYAERQADLREHALKGQLRP